MKRTNLANKLLSCFSNTENSIICPHGIAAVLSMVAEGANETAVDEILACLGFDSLEVLRSTVLEAVECSCDAFTSDNAVVLLQGQEDATLQPSFRQAMLSQYAAALHETPSHGEPVVLLSNVATFKAQWFRKMTRTTGTHTFRNADGSVSRPAFLRCRAGLRCYRSDDYFLQIQAVALPYKLEEQEAPFELVLVDGEQPLSAEQLHHVLSHMSVEECDVNLPEFSIRSEWNLVSMMKVLGIKKMFDARHRALNRMATVPLYATSFVQEAEIQVDKEGTEAKAFTGMLMGGCSGAKYEFDKPFYYFLRNTHTGEILFMGKVNCLADCEPERQNLDWDLNLIESIFRSTHDDKDAEPVSDPIQT